MNEFISKYESQIGGVISGFDRLVFRGNLRSLVHEQGRKSYLWQSGSAEGVWKTCGTNQPSAQGSVGGGSGETGPSGEVPQAERRQRGDRPADCRRTEDRQRTGVRDQERGAMLELRDLPQPRREEVEAGQAAPPVPILVPLPNPSRVRVHERPDSIVVSVSGADLHERTGMAVAANGPGRFGVRTAGQLLSLASQL